MKSSSTVTTCQICARAIKANTGYIAHHGYTRPGNGWQTSSCMGAQQLPYEVSRDYIPVVIERYEAIKKNLTERVNDLTTNPPATITETSRYRGDATYERPEDFKIGGYSSIPGTYANAYAHMVRETETNLKGVTAEIEFLQKRYNDWKAK